MTRIASPLVSRQVGNPKPENKPGIRQALAEGREETGEYLIAERKEKLDMSYYRKRHSKPFVSLENPFIENTG